MKRGEVRWHRLSAPDKRRPILILTRHSVINVLGEVTIAPITTTVRDIPSEVFLSRADGVPRECAVNCDHLQTVSKGKIGALLTELSSQKLDEVSEAIAFALAL